MKTEDLDFIASAEGYVIYYRGKSIGGASIRGKSKARGQARIKQMNDHAERAKRQIASILQGHIPKRMEDAIQIIDDANELFPQPVISSMG